MTKDKQEELFMPLMKDRERAEEIRKALEQEPTRVYTVEGVGTARVYGKLDVEKVIKRLLESKAIRGY